MARLLNRLTARQVETLTKPGRHADGGGLYLKIDASGRRRWTFFYRFGGKHREMGLGSAAKGGVPLARARELAAAARALMAEGKDPLEAKRVAEPAAVTVPSFGEFADAFVETMRPSWRNAKHADQWAMTLTHYCAPIRDLPVNAVDTKAVLSVLRPIWTTKPETAKRLRGRIENVLDAAKAKGFRSGENPALWRGHLALMLPKRLRLTRGHHAALPWRAMPEFMEALRAREAVAARLLELVILTATRSGEAIGARWDEIDLEHRIWTIPATRMKAGREHRVPLSDRAVTILREMEVIRVSEVVFPARRGMPHSNMAMAQLLKRMGRAGITVHGFRSAFRDWASEATGFPHEVCEMALAHTIGNKAEAAYRRGDLFEKRRELMQAWQVYLDTEINGYRPVGQ